MPERRRCRREHDLDARPIGLELIGKDSREGRHNSLAHLGMRTLQRNGAVATIAIHALSERVAATAPCAEHVVAAEAARNENDPGSRSGLEKLRRDNVRAHRQCS